MSVDRDVQTEEKKERRETGNGMAIVPNTKARAEGSLISFDKLQSHLAVATLLRVRVAKIVIS